MKIRFVKFASVDSVSNVDQMAPPRFIAAMFQGIIQIVETDWDIKKTVYGSEHTQPHGRQTLLGI